MTGNINGQSIFLPAAGSSSDGVVYCDGEEECYWGYVYSDIAYSISAVDSRGVRPVLEDE